MKKFLLLTSMMILAGTPLVAQENLLKNPEFEGTGEALPTHWGKGPIGKVRRIPAPAGTNAKFAIEITKTAADDPKPFAYAIQANLDIKKIQNYTYTAQSSARRNGSRDLCRSQQPRHACANRCLRGNPGFNLT